MGRLPEGCRPAHAADPANGPSPARVAAAAAAGPDIDFDIPIARIPPLRVRLTVAAGSPGAGSVTEDASARATPGRAIDHNLAVPGGNPHCRRVAIAAAACYRRESAGIAMQPATVAAGSAITDADRRAVRARRALRERDRIATVSARLGIAGRTTVTAIGIASNRDRGIRAGSDRHRIAVAAMAARAEDTATGWISAATAVPTDGKRFGANALSVDHRRCCRRRATARSACPAVGLHRGSVAPFTATAGLDVGRIRRVAVRTYTPLDRLAVLRCCGGTTVVAVFAGNENGFRRGSERHQP